MSAATSTTLPSCRGSTILAEVGAWKRLGKNRIQCHLRDRQGPLVELLGIPRTGIDGERKLHGLRVLSRAIT